MELRRWKKNVPVEMITGSSARVLQFRINAAGSVANLGFNGLIAIAGSVRWDASE